jgi:hypothetical protein
VFGTEERAIAFSPAEVDLLFPGPFSRRQIVAYKLMKLAIGSLTASVFFSIWTWRFAVSYGNAVVGAALTLVFVNLLSTIVALLQETLEDGDFATARRLLQAGLVGAVAAIGLRVHRSDAPILDTLAALGASPVTRAITAPFRVFAHVFAASSLLELAGWTSACVALIGVATAVVFALDRGYLEAALTASRRRQERVTRVARSGIGALGGGGPVRAIPLPELAFLGGAGAIVRRQVLTAVRTSRGWLLLFALVVGYAFFVSRALDETRSGHANVLAGMLPGASVLLVLLPQMLRFDFRADLDQIDHLKTLPLTPRAIVLAELTTPVLALVGLAWLMLACLGMSSPIDGSLIAMAALGIVPIALLLVGLENFAFLILPSRLLGPNQAAVAFSGRRIVLMLSRLVFAGIGASLVAVVGVVTAVTTHSRTFTYAACWGTTFALGLGVAAAVAWAFVRFDVSQDMPG